MYRFNPFAEMHIANKYVDHQLLSSHFSLSELSLTFESLWVSMWRDHRGDSGLPWLSEGNTTIAYFRRSLPLKHNAGSLYMQARAMKLYPALMK